jgi:hypothetical protein
MQRQIGTARALRHQAAFLGKAAALSGMAEC